MEKIFENVDINTRTFEDEIKASISLEIVAKYNGVGYVDRTLTVLFTEDLAPGGVIDLENLVAAHDHTKKKPYYLIYDLLPNKENYNIYEIPYSIDFITQLTSKLKKKTLAKVQGKPTSVEYYQNYSNGFYSDIILRRDFVLIYDSGGFITEKQDVVRWYMSDGSISSATKNIGQLYDPILDMEARIKEGKTRRGSIIDGLQLPVLAGLLESQPNEAGDTFEMKKARMILIGRAFIQRYSKVFIDFIDHSDKSVVQAMWDADEEWLDVPIPSWGGYTIRGYILNEINI